MGPPEYGTGGQGEPGFTTQIPGQPPNRARMLQEAIQGGAVGQEQMGRLLGLDKPGEHFMSTPYGVFEPSSQRFITPGGEGGGNQQQPSEAAPEGMQWAPTRDVYGRVGWRAVAKPKTQGGPSNVWEGALQRAKEELQLPEDSPATAEVSRRAMSILAEHEGSKTGERTKSGIQAKFERMGQLAEVKKAEELAKRDPEIISRDLQKSDAFQGILVKHAGEKAQATAEGKLKGGMAVDPDTGVSLNELTEIQKSRGRPLPAEITQQVHLYRSTIDTIDRVRKEFTEDEVLKFAGIWNRGEKYVEQAVKQDPRFFKFLVLNEQLRSTAFQYGGKQLTPFEASVVFGFTPTGRELFAQLWVEKMNELEAYTRTRLNQMETLVNQPRGAVAPTQPLPSRPGWTPPPTKGGGSRLVPKPDGSYDFVPMGR